MGRPIVTLLTDFGLRDAYVGCMKGVILGICPQAELVDLSHGVNAQAVGEGAFLLEVTVPYFPPGTIHLAVVDPGVGTERRAIAVQTEFAAFVGPDNGLFVPCLDAMGALDPRTGVPATGVTAVELRDTRYRLPHVSRTFHGRDIFAPAAAFLAAGIAIEELGPAVDRLIVPERYVPEVGDGVIVGAVRYIDGFGNAISNISGDMVPARPLVEIAGHTIGGVAESYQQFEIVALVGSSGYLEVAERNGSACQRFGLLVGDQVVVRAGS